MKRAALVALVGGFGVVVAGCSSPLKNAGNADASVCPISGNYSVTHTFQEMSPGCAASNGLTTSDTYTFSVDEGVVTLMVASLGGSCSGQANGCDLPLSCTANLNNSGGTAMFTTTYAFTSTGFSGRLILIEMPTGGGTCEYVYQDTGTLMQ
jgi:hypothetical protein